MNIIKRMLILIHSRNKEFYRDKGSLSWAIIFPILAILGCYLAFSNKPDALFTVGIIHNTSFNNVFDPNYTKTISYQNKKKALQRINQHQLDVLIDYNDAKFWINDHSGRGLFLAKMISLQLPDFKKQTLQGYNIRYIDWVLPGILGMNIMFGALFGAGYVIVRYRKNGVLKRLQATPLSSFEFLLAQVLSRLLIIISANSVIFTGSVFLLDLTMKGSYFNLFIITLLGTSTLISLGLLMSSRTESEELAGGLLNLTTWPMMFLSGVWFSLDSAPQWLQQISLVSPLTHLLQAGREIMLHGASLMSLKFEILSMIAMLCLFLSLSAYLFRWHKTS
jgi:ABC-2 type transport system permease protein